MIPAPSPSARPAQGQIARMVRASSGKLLSRYMELCMKSASRIASCAIVIATLIAAVVQVSADPGKIVIRVDQPGAKINPLLFGLMTEEINYSYDGGLYAELIQNRVFKNAARRGEPTDAIPHWSV